MVLEGGIKGWVKAGPQFIQFMDGFEEEYWRKMFASDDSEQIIAQQQSVTAAAIAENGVHEEPEQSIQPSKRPLSTYQDDHREKRVQW